MLLALLGLAHGDAFGETLFGPPEDSARRVAERRLAARRPWRWTDDTAMAWAVVETLTRHGTIDADALMAALVRQFAAEPDRGYGGGARDLLTRVVRGADWRVEVAAMFDGQGSFGNGAAMRVAPLGAYFADDLDRVVAEAARSAAPTHAHPEGVAGAVAVAVAAALAWRHGHGQAMTGAAWLAAIAARTPDGLTRAGLARAQALGLGHGRAYHLPGLDGLEQRTIDWRFRTRGPRPLRDARIVVIGLDDETRRSAPEVYQTRRGWARLIRALAAAEPDAIALDLFFSAPEILLPEELARQVEDAYASAQAEPAPTPPAPRWR